MKKQIFKTAMIGILSFSTSNSLIGSLPCNSQTQPNSKVVNDPKFHARLLEIAAEYSKYGKIDSQSRLAPALCMMPPPRTSFPIQLSKSKDVSTHGQKLYYLYARDRMAYVNNPDVEGQVVVKESWSQLSAEEVKVKQGKKNGGESLKHPVVLDTNDLIGPKSGLFIMFRSDSKTPDTDEGWIYGTVTADGKVVTSAGRVQSCMECHASAPYGRLFGLKK